jgi:hypothetical protein
VIQKKEVTPNFENLDSISSNLVISIFFPWEAGTAPIEP